MKRLTLILPSGWPEQTRRGVWLLRDEAGALLESGCSEPAHWPGRQGDEAGTMACELLLAGPQVGCQQAALPAGPRSRKGEVLAAAVEDELLEPVHRTQLAATPQAGSATAHQVLVVSSARLQTVLQTLRELGLRPDRASALGQALRPGHAMLCGAELTLRRDDGHFLGLPVDAALPQWLTLLEPRPWACAAPDAELSAEALPVWRDLLDRGTLRSAGLAECLHPTPSGPGLLHGPWLPPRAPLALARMLRPAARTVAGLALVALLVLAGQWAWLSWQARQLSQESARLFRQTFPQAAVVDPLLQMQRQFEQAQRRAGWLSEGDFLALLRPLSDLSPATLQLQAMNYEAGRLELTAGLRQDGLAALRAASLQHGIALEVHSEQGLQRIVLRAREARP